MKTSESASARWTRILHEQRASGLSIAEFCRRRDVSPPSFFAWRRRLSLGAASVPAFVQVKVDQAEASGPAANAALELVLPRGLRVLVRRGFDPEALRELLAALEASA